MNRIDSGLFTVQEFRNRGVVKLGPDALVYISGSIGDAVAVPVSGGNQSVDFNDGITQISVQNNIDPPGSSNASIEVSTPIYGEHSRYWLPFDDPQTGRTYRVPMFQPMAEVKIFFKGRFLVKNGETRVPKYYPAFWGFITNVEENYSGGLWKINISCADMLHWWEYSQVNIHPIPASEIAAGSGLKITPFSTIFEDANPYTILYTLTQDMGMHEMVVPTFVGQLTPLSQQYPPGALRRLMTGQVMEYWRQRFGQLASLLKMYGMSGQEVEVNAANNTIRTKQPLTTRSTEQQGTSDAKDAAYSRVRGDFAVDNDYLEGFHVFFDFDKMGTFDDAEYMSKLAIATEVKNRVDFEFFQDVTGDWVFKPPFYNLNTKSLYPYNIKSHDIISNSFSVDSEGIVTVMEIQTPMDPHLKVEGSSPVHKGFHIDAELAARYGIRYKRQHLEYLVKNNANIGNQMAVAYMSLNNAKAFTGSVTIPGRPELRLGFPVYLEHRDSFHYVKSINHSFDYGGSFTTTLSLEAERKKVYNLDNGVWVGPLKDYINEYKGSAAIEDIRVTSGDNQGPRSRNEFSEKAARLQEETGRLSSLKQGRYALAKRNPSRIDQLAVTSQSVPVTDEEGYRVIGGFRYGRGILVTGSTTLDTADVQSALEFLANPDSLIAARQNKIVAGMEPGGYEVEANQMGEALANIRTQQGLVPQPLEFFNLDDTQSDVGRERTAEKIVNNKPSNAKGPQQNSNKTVDGAQKGSTYEPGTNVQQERQRQASQ